MRTKAMSVILFVSMQLGGMEQPEQPALNSPSKGTITVVVDGKEFKSIPRELLKYSGTICQMLEEFEDAKEDIETLDLSPFITLTRFENVYALLKLLSAENHVEVTAITRWDMRALYDLIEDIDWFQIDDVQKQVSKHLRENNNMRVHLLSSCKIPHSFRNLGDASAHIRYQKFCFSSDGRQATFYGSYRIVVSNFDQNFNKRNTQFKNLSNRVSSICYSGAHLIFGFENGTLFMFSNFNAVDEGDNLSDFVGHERAISSLCCHPSNEGFVSASHDTTVKVWNIYTQDPLYTLKGHTAPVSYVCFSPNGETIASCSQDSTVRLWSVGTGKKLAVFTGHVAPVYSVCFHPHGITLASCSQDRTIRCWDSIAEKELSQFEGTNKKMKQCCYSPDGNLFIASNSTGIHIWDVVSGKKINVLENGLNYSVSLSYDGRYIFALQWPRHDFPQITWPVLCVWDISDLNFVNKTENFTLSQTLLLQQLDQKNITPLQVKRNKYFSAIFNRLSPFIKKQYALGFIGTALFKLSLVRGRFKNRT